MAWVRLDDHIDEHPKVARAAGDVGDSGLATLVSAIAYSNRNLTDGFIPSTAVRCLTLHRRPAAVAAALVAAGLWEEVEGGFLIHDYSDYQASRESVVAKRQKVAEKVAQHRARNADVTPDVTGYTDAGNGPVPSLTGASQPQVRKTSPNGEVVPLVIDPEIERLCQLHSDLCRKRTDTPSSSRKYRVTDEWRRDMRRLVELDGRTVAEVEAAIKWVDRSSFWSPNVLSPAKLRHHFDALRLAGRDERAKDPKPRLVHSRELTDDRFERKPA